MGGIADSLNRSQQNIDSIAGKVQDFYKRKRMEEDQNSLYSALKQYQTPQTSTDVLSTANPIPANTGLSSKSFDAINKPLVVPNTQPARASSRMDALRMYLENNPGALANNTAVAPLVAQEQMFAPKYENITPGTMRQKTNWMGQPEGEPVQIGQPKLPVGDELFHAFRSKYEQTPAGQAQAAEDFKTLSNRQQTFDQTVVDKNGNPVITKTPDGTSWTTKQKIDAATKKPIEGTQEKVPLIKPSNTDVEKPEKNPELSGIPYLNTLPTGRKSLVKAIGEGRTKLRDVTSYRGNQKIELAKDVVRSYPTFDQRWIDASFALAKDATTGNIAKNARSLNMAIGHLEQFDKAAQALNNVDITGYNSIANWMSHNTGDPRVIAVMVPAKALKAELASATKGGASGAAGTEAEIADWGKVFDLNLSKGEFAQATNSTFGVLGSRISALNEQYKNTPYHPAEFDVISPPAKAILDSYNFDFTKYDKGATNKEPASTQSKNWWE